jgi:uncharacterized protein YkwD
MPIVCGVTFFGLVVTSQAMLGGSQPGFGQALAAALARGGWLPTTTYTPQPPTSAPTATETMFAPTPDYAATATQGAWLRSVASPSPTATSSMTAMPSETLTPSITPTASETPTATPSPTASWTMTSTPSRTPTRTPWPTATNTRIPPPTDTPAPTDTPSQAPTAGPSPTPSDTPVPTIAPSATPASCDAGPVTGYESQILTMVNDERRSQGLGPLQPQSQLQAAARVQATDMACNHFTGHTGSDGSSVRDRVEAQGYTWSWIGENYMVTSQGPQYAFDWWMNSQPHRDNILGANYTEIGVGVIYSADSDYGTYYVLVFARPG